MFVQHADTLLTEIKQVTKYLTNVIGDNDIGTGGGEKLLALYGNIKWVYDHLVEHNDLNSNVKKKKKNVRNMHVAALPLQPLRACTKTQLNERKGIKTWINIASTRVEGNRDQTRRTIHTSLDEKKLLVAYPRPLFVLLSSFGFKEPSPVRNSRLRRRFNNTRRQLKI